MTYERASRTTVLLVDDQPLFTEALELVLSAHEWIEVVGRAADGAEAVALADALRPEVVLMDLHMPGVDGAEATRRILRSLPGTAVVMLSSSGEPEDVERSVEAGAAAYLTKDVDAERLVETILGAGTPPANRGRRAVPKVLRRILGAAPAFPLPTTAVVPARAER